MVELVVWAKTHLAEITEGYLALVGLASWAVKLTPTVADDNILKGIIKFVGKFIAVDKYGPPSPK